MAQIIRIESTRSNAWYSDCVGQNFEVSEVFLHRAGSPDDSPKRRYFQTLSNPDNLIHPCDCIEVA